MERHPFNQPLIIPCDAVRAIQSKGDGPLVLLCDRTFLDTIDDWALEFYTGKPLTGDNPTETYEVVVRKADAEKDLEARVRDRLTMWEAAYPENGDCRQLAIAMLSSLLNPPGVGPDECAPQEAEDPGRCANCDTYLGEGSNPGELCINCPRGWESVDGGTVQA